MAVWLHCQWQRREGQTPKQGYVNVSKPVWWLDADILLSKAGVWCLFLALESRNSIVFIENAALDLSTSFSVCIEALLKSNCDPANRGSFYRKDVHTGCSADVWAYPQRWWKANTMVGIPAEKVALPVFQSSNIRVGTTRQRAKKERLLTVFKSSATV